jgi:hypothetical protein
MVWSVLYLTGPFSPRVRARDQVAEALACGPDVEAHVEAVRPYIDAGFDEIALVQVGAEHQEPFISWARDELLPALRSL